MNIIKNIIWQWRKYIAIKAAIRAHEADGKKYLVINLDGKPTVVTKGKIREMKQRGLLRKGVTVQDFEKRAIFISK